MIILTKLGPAKQGISQWVGNSKEKITYLIESLLLEENPGWKLSWSADFG